jgi:hypothetical protein
MTEVPHLGHVLCRWHASEQSHCLTHRVTGEVVALPGQGVGQCHPNPQMSADGGLLVTINGVATPASQHLQTALHKDPATHRLFVTRPGHTAWVRDLRGEWATLYPEWTAPGAAKDKLMCKIIKWGWHFEGCKLFWQLHGVLCCLGAAGAQAKKKYITDRWPVWRESLKVHAGCADGHWWSPFPRGHGGHRRPASNNGAPEELAASVDGHSCSTMALLGLLAWIVVTHNWGPAGKACCQAGLQFLIHRFACNGPDIRIVLNRDAIPEEGHCFIASARGDQVMHLGVLDGTVAVAACRHALSELGARRAAARLTGERVHLAALLLHCVAHRADCKPFITQLLLHLSEVVERGVLAENWGSDPTALGRARIKHQRWDAQLQVALSGGAPAKEQNEGGLGKAEAALGRPVGMAAWRAAWQSKALLSYYMGCRKLMHQARTLHVSLDASRVGKKEVLMIAFMANGQACWAPPQDPATQYDIVLISGQLIVVAEVALGLQLAFVSFALGCMCSWPSCSHGLASPSPSYGRLDLQPRGARNAPRKVTEIVRKLSHGKSRMRFS